ncbi:MAG: YceI family protein [Gemmatimonadaceae bacterium]|nr:YceI family protein [Gemmatimonadaceae bacterium]
MLNTSYRTVPLLGALLGALAATTPASAQKVAARELSLEASHSSVEFSIGFLTGRVKGRFDDVRGTLFYDGERPERSSITVVIGAASIHSGSRHRDEHLRSSDFFDVTRFPHITFTSERVTRAGNGLLVSGPLEMHGATRNVAIPFRQVRPLLEDPHGSDIVNFEGSLRLARKDFGILGGAKFNSWFDDIRSATMADSVDVMLEIQAWETNFVRLRRWDGALDRFKREGIGPTAKRLRAMKAMHADSIDGVDWELDQIARTLVARERPAEAIELLELSVELLPASAASHASLSRVYELTGDRRAALASAERALALNATNTRALELARRLR